MDAKAQEGRTILLQGQVEIWTGKPCQVVTDQFGNRVYYDPAYDKSLRPQKAKRQKAKSNKNG